MTDRQMKMLSEISAGIATAQNGLESTPDWFLLDVVRRYLDEDFRSMGLREMSQLAVYWNELKRRGLQNKI